MARYGDLDTQYFDDAGDPLVNGKIYFYESGTTTLKDTYADVDLTVPNTNPVILTAAGRQPNIFFNGVAKAILATSSGTQILVRDPVGDTANSFGNPWIASKRYSANDVVQGSDGEYYVSLVSGNVNNNPVTTTGSWTFLYSVEWSAGTTYKVGSVVTYEAIVYQSMQNANLNKNPSTEAAWWVPIQLAWIATQTYALDANVVGSDGVLYTSIQAANTGNDPASSPLWWVGTSGAAAASAISAAASAAAALVSENAAALSEVAALASENAADADAAAAAASAASAAATAGAALWVSGQAYVVPDAAVSPVNLQTYRANTSTSGTTDPSLSADWTLISVGSYPLSAANGGTGVTSLPAGDLVGTTATQTLTGKTIRDTVYTLSGTAFDATNGAIQTKTLAAIVTFTDSMTSGDAIVLMLEGGATYAVTWPTMTWVTSGGNVAPTLTAKDTLVFWKISTTLYGAYTGSYV